MNYHDHYDIANFFNEHFANISFSVQLNRVSDPPNWECIANYVDSKNFVRTSLCSYLLARLLGWTTLVAIFLKQQPLSIFDCCF